MTIATDRDGLAASPLARLEYLNAIGVSLSGERDIGRLLEAILAAAKALTGADGGTLYRVVGRELRFEIVRNDSLGIALGGPGKSAPDLAALPLSMPDGSPNRKAVACHAALSGKTVNIADAYARSGFDFAAARDFDRRTGYRSQSFLAVPMRNHEGEVIAVLQLVNAMDSSGRVRAFDAEGQRLAESLASQAAVALANRDLINQLETLFESLATLINSAIDAKSIHTGGHCQRVPVLTMMIAEAAHDASEGPLAEFRMTDKDRHELKIAALLHDCGKIVTPAHVMDKATKLQTIQDRIALIATRFEAAKASAKAAMWEVILSAREAKDPATEARAREAYAQEAARLDADFAFLARANVGSEKMRPEDQSRVRAIGARSYARADGGSEPLLTADEVENLTIASGTLLPREREVMNQHIVSTITMLEALPWPRHLERVPEYAGGHHERVDGRGYPRGLTRDQMSVPARIMAIADIFEALTAADRPYKTAKSLSESLSILSQMHSSGHIDPDLFRLFVREKLYLRYAQRFLPAAQIDMHEVAKLPGFGAND